MRRCGTAEKKKWGKVTLEEIKQIQCKSAKIITGFTSPVPPSSDQNGFAAVSVLQKKEVHSLVYFFGRHLNSAEFM